MSQTAPIADMLATIRNALLARKVLVVFPSSRLKLEMLQVMKEAGYIAGFKVSEEGAFKTVSVELKYGGEGENVINGLEVVSRPSLRVYSGWRNMPKVLDGLGIAIVSTSQGLMTGEEARAKKVGGEVLCKVW